MSHRSYICFEGIDGAGKSVQMAMYSDFLTRQGFTPICLHEPSYGAYGLEIRRRAISGSIGNIEQQREIFTADRRDHVRRKIRPLLEFVGTRPGFVVLQSRSYISAAAYQSTTDDNSSLEAVLADQEALTPAPDRILIFDLPVEEAMARLEHRGRPDAFEVKGTLERVRQRYLKIAKSRTLCVLVDATGTPELVASRVRRALGIPGKE